MGLYLVGVDPLGMTRCSRMPSSAPALSSCRSSSSPKPPNWQTWSSRHKPQWNAPGTYISGERRAQYFGAAVPALEGTKSDHASLRSCCRQLVNQPCPQPTKNCSPWHLPEIEFAKCTRSKEQWPAIGGKDAYYGGTASKNTFGLGVHLPLVSSTGCSRPLRCIPQKLNSRRVNGLQCLSPSL